MSKAKCSHGRRAFISWEFFFAALKNLLWLSTIIIGYAVIQHENKQIAAGVLCVVAGLVNLFKED